MLHYQLTHDEKKLTSKAARNGASFDYPTMWCLTGDGELPDLFKALDAISHRVFLKRVRL